MHDLRLDELGTVRPTAPVADHADPRPPTWRMPPANADLVEQVETLRRQVDELNGDAEYLWFEAQWLRRELTARRVPSEPRNMVAPRGPAVGAVHGRGPGHRDTATSFRKQRRRPVATSPDPSAASQPLADHCGRHRTHLAATSAAWR